MGSERACEHPGMHRLARRMQRIDPFEVMEVLDLARALERDGADVIHLEVGEPDFATPGPVVEAAARALAEQPMTYTSAIGMPQLREAISRWYRDALGVEVPMERIVVTTGSSAALLMALGVTVNPGDRVVVGDPGYPCNRHFAGFVDAEPLLVPAGADTAYQLTADLLREAWRPGVRAVVAASPSNPTGTLIPLAQWRAMAELCAERGAVLIADEIYQGLVYGREAETVLSVTDDVFVVNSFSKYFQMTGWRLGWLVVPAGWTREVEKLAQNLFICPPTLSQHAALAATSPQTIAILESRRAELRARRDVLLAQLPRTGLRVHAVPEGAFYVYADSSELGADSFALARRWLTQTHVALTPGRDFGVASPERHVRIAYTQPAERLVEAVDRLSAAV